MSQKVSYARHDDIGVITVDNPPVNALSQAVRRGLAEAVTQGLADGQVRALIIIGAGRAFIAGADIREFNKPLQPPNLPEVIARINAADKPIVAVLHGATLGGGLEVALGCHYRLALADGKMGLPEVKLGFLPGAGGTQRLPRLIGVEAALDLITSGRFVAVQEAYKLGLVDAVVQDKNPLTAGLDFVRRLLSEGRGPRRVSVLSVPADATIFEVFRAKLAKTARGQLAPLRCVDAIEAAANMPFEQGLERERELFLACFNSPQSKGMVHAFFAEREAAKVAGLPKHTPHREIKRAAVIGAGTMGGGIAMCFANAGLPVTVVEINDQALRRGLDVVHGNYAASVGKGRLPQDAMDKRMALIKGSTDYAAAAAADIVVEAVFEEMDVKRKVFQELDKVCKPGAILATNTSSLDVNAIATVTGRPEEVIGTHFFSPANVMKLLEIVRGERTQADVIATTMKLGRTLGKVCVLVGVCDGFVGNRMLFHYAREAEFLLEEGALPQQVDKALFEFGMPMGPFAMQDMAGLDVVWRIRKRHRRELPSNYRLPDILDRICKQGRFGQKTGSGFYLYEKGKREPTPDPEIEALILGVSKEHGIERCSISDEEIVKRCVYALINEGANILEEGIAQRPGDIDVIYIYGYGFPAYRGGPMFYVDSLGLDRVYADITGLHERHGTWWTPAPLLERLAREGRGFRNL